MQQFQLITGNNQLSSKIVPRRDVVSLEDLVVSGVIDEISYKLGELTQEGRALREDMERRHQENLKTAADRESDLKVINARLESLLAASNQSIGEARVKASIWGLVGSFALFGAEHIWTYLTQRH